MIAPGGYPATGIVLAGGRSARMGRDKANLVLDGMTLLERCVLALEAVSDEVLVIGRRAAEGAVGSVFLSDDAAGLGPIGGLRTGLRAAQHDLAIVVPCDMPFLNPLILRQLLTAAPGFDASVPTVSGELRPLPAVYARSALSAINRRIASGSLSLRGLLHELRVCPVPDIEFTEIDPELRSFTNVNTPEELSRVLSASLSDDPRLAPEPNPLPG